MPRIAIVFDTFGPYHLARLQEASSVTELLAVQVAARSANYAWENSVEIAGQKPGSGGEWKMVTLLDRRTSLEVQPSVLSRRMDQALDDFRPQVVFIPGWSSQAAFAALCWCVRNNIPAVGMSESTELDERRRVWKEWVKRILVRLFATALVAGRPHMDYMVKLGMSPEQIFLGYDVVENRYFAEKSEENRKLKTENRKQYELPQNYFLASARFIVKKNLPRLLQAYARYRELAEKSRKGKEKAETWDLVLLGDGPLKPDLCRLISDLRLNASVHLPGFQQYPDLPVFYGLASAFIHASTTEQWGLVVNEAMASGLPVIVSNRCGCAKDLVQEGLNGFSFDPYDIGQLAKLMLKVSQCDFPLSSYGLASQQIIAQWGTDRFANGLRAAAERAFKIGPKHATLLDQFLLKCLLFT